MTAPATYGSLMLRAALGIQHGVVWMQNLPLERREHAETAINDFHDVLGALKEHTWVLLELRRVNWSRPTPMPRACHARRTSTTSCVTPSRDKRDWPRSAT